MKIRREGDNSSKLFQLTWPFPLPPVRRGPVAVRSAPGEETIARPTMDHQRRRKNKNEGIEK